MANNSNIPEDETLDNTQNGEMNRAHDSSPNFGFGNNNYYKNNEQANKNAQNDTLNKMKQQRAQIKKVVVKEAIKKGAQAYGVPEVATDAILNSRQGDEIIDAATKEDNPAKAGMEVSKLVTKKYVLPIVLISISPLLLIIIMFVVIFSKDSFSGVGDTTDLYEDLRQEIASVANKNKYKVDIDGNLILATLIGYNDNEEMEESDISSRNMAYMKRQVSKLAEYQIVTNTSCNYDSSSIREIANNDGLFGDDNYNCIPNMDTTTYTLSIAEGSMDDNNSGSVYFWNLIDEDFIFDYYNDYMINKSSNTSENKKKISEIISEIYLYYKSIGDSISSENLFSQYNDSEGYWWPVGSKEVTVVNGKTFATGLPSSVHISSYFGAIDSIRYGRSHSGLDISSNGFGTNYHNIIASKGGVVVYPTSLLQVQNPDSVYIGNNVFLTKTGSNNVIIMHDDGNYTVYAHLYGGSVTVKAGDRVEQGQVIGKMGSSGNSTGPHLHFEIRVGANISNNVVDPLAYISVTDPRPVDSKLSNWLKASEKGNASRYIDGNNYIVYKEKDGRLVVGYGVTIVDNFNNQLHTDIYSTQVNEGSKIPMSIVDSMYEKVINNYKQELMTKKIKYNVVLESNQDDALLSYMYSTNSNRIDELLELYSQTSNSDSVWEIISTSTYGNGTMDTDSKRRRAEEYELFTKGDYKFDPLTGSDIKYYDIQSW